MARYIKCQGCLQTEDYNNKSEMECVEKVSEKGNVKRLYFHKGKCYEEYVSHQKFIEQEMKEKDELNDVLKEIYNIKHQIPPMIWEFIQSLRNGTNRYEKVLKKRYKKGVPYSVIAEAYRMSKDSIVWARLNRNFKTVQSEMTYGLRIMQGKIEDAHKKMKISKQSESFAKARENMKVDNDYNEYSSEERLKQRSETKKHTSKKHIDISNYLDD